MSGKPTYNKQQLDEIKSRILELMRDETEYDLEALESLLSTCLLTRERTEGEESFSGLDYELFDLAITSLLNKGKLEPVKNTGFSYQLYANRTIVASGRVVSVKKVV